MTVLTLTSDVTSLSSVTVPFPKPAMWSKGKTLPLFYTGKQWNARTFGRYANIYSFLQIGLVELHFCQFFEQFHVSLHSKGLQYTNLHPGKEQTAQHHVQGTRDGHGWKDWRVSRGTNIFFINFALFCISWIPHVHTLEKVACDLKATTV